METIILRGAEASGSASASVNFIVTSHNYDEYINMNNMNNNSNNNNNNNNNDNNNDNDNSGQEEDANIDLGIKSDVSTQDRLKLYAMHMQQIRTSAPDMLFRKGHWTTEEDEYASKMIDFFNKGLLQTSECPKGTSLRAYLAEKLQCDPMRITKKYKKMGKKVYLGPRDESGCEVSSDNAVLAAASCELSFAEERFLSKIELQVKVQMQMQLLNATSRSKATTGDDILSNSRLNLPAKQPVVAKAAALLLSGNIIPPISNVHIQNEYIHNLPIREDRSRAICDTKRKSVDSNHHFQYFNEANSRGSISLTSNIVNDNNAVAVSSLDNDLGKRRCVEEKIKKIESNSSIASQICIFDSPKVSPVASYANIFEVEAFPTNCDSVGQRGTSDGYLELSIFNIESDMANV